MSPEQGERCRESDAETEEREKRAFLQDDLHQNQSIGAERRADSELVRPLADSERQNPSDAHCRYGESEDANAPTRVAFNLWGEIDSERICASVLTFRTGCCGASLRIKSRIGRTTMSGWAVRTKSELGERHFGSRG